MKVVKAQEVAEMDSNVEVQNETKNPNVDPKKVEELREKFDVLNAELNDKKYDLLLDADLTEILLTKLYSEFLWKGYESYAVSETYTQFEQARTGKGINSGFAVEVIEAAFHFLKNHVGKGYELAVPYRKICDQFAMVIQEINKDRQTLKDLSLELVSAEQGIKVEDLVEAMNRHSQQQQQNQQY